MILNTLRPRLNGRHFPDAIFKWIFLNENVWIAINISLKFVPRGPINNIPTLVQVMAWGRPGYKPLSEPMMVRLPTHVCVTLPQWVKTSLYFHQYRLMPSIRLPLPCELIESWWCIYMAVNWVIIGSGNGLSSEQSTSHYLNLCCLTVN